MNKKVAILQSSYIPWKGYFDIINSVDEFILFDDVQYTERDWRNRNRIKTPNGSHWLSIPVDSGNKLLNLIYNKKIVDKHWSKKHWASIERNYCRSPFFDEYSQVIRDQYEKSLEIESLSQVNYGFIKTICNILGIDTNITWSMDYHGNGKKTDRLIDLCLKSGANYYLSGPSARNYIHDTSFIEAGIVLEYMDYMGYPEYNQLYPPFNHFVTVLDLIFNVGTDAIYYMKSFSIK